MQLIPVISSLTPFTTAVPLILVLMLTAFKDAYDDFVSYPTHTLCVIFFIYIMDKSLFEMWNLRKM